MWLYKSPNFIYGCWLYNFKVLFSCLKEAERSVRTAPGFLHTAPWILNKPSERDTVPWPHTFRERAGQRRCTNRGRNFVRSKRWSPYMSSTTSTYFFCVLTIRKHLLKMRFERSGRGQEPSRGHKFSILENVVLHRDFTSSMHLHFRLSATDNSDLSEGFILYNISTAYTSSCAESPFSSASLIWKNSPS